MAGAATLPDHGQPPADNPQPDGPSSATLSISSNTKSQTEYRPATNGISTLTAQQARVLDLLTQGLSNKDIARVMGISPRTVEIHRSHALRVIGARNGIHGAVIWDRHQRSRTDVAFFVGPDLIRAKAAFAEPFDPAPPAAQANPFDRALFTAERHHVYRNGEHIASTTTPALARALALALDCQLLFPPDVPPADQDFVAQTLWPNDPTA
jgi:DNA-binding CsgD family transcriptional regulator